MTTITIKVKQSLKELKRVYNEFYGNNKGTRVTKAEIAIWLGVLAESDVESSYNDEELLITDTKK